jgi:hypothetical protein
MAPARKSAKRSAPKNAKRSAPKKKKSAAKSSSKRSSPAKARGKALKAARAGLGSMLQAGEKTWKKLKSTTTEVVQDVKETLGRRAPRTRKRRPAR